MSKFGMMIFLWTRLEAGTIPTFKRLEAGIPYQKSNFFIFFLLTLILTLKRKIPLKNVPETRTCSKKTYPNMFEKKIPPPQRIEAWPVLEYTQL